MSTSHDNHMIIRYLTANKTHNQLLVKKYNINYNKINMNYDLYN